MRSWYVIMAVVLIFIGAGSSAKAQSCAGLIEIELWLDETTIQSCGVLVGELIFTNTGDETCQFGGIMKLDAENLHYELELPGGDIIQLKRHTMADRYTVQWAQLAPGEETRHPVCLMKLDRSFIFEEIGNYRIRAVFRLRGLSGVNMITGEVTHVNKSFTVRSEWVDFVVVPAGRGRANYVNSHPQDNIYATFYFSSEVEAIWANMATYYDYRHEHEKFIIYQRYGRRMARGLLKSQQYDEELIKDAEEMLELAWEYGVGISMWGWIVKRLKAFPLKEEGRQKYNTANGYYF